MDPDTHQHGARRPTGLLIVIGPNNQILITRNLRHTMPQWRFPNLHRAGDETTQETAMRALRVLTGLRIESRNTNFVLCHNNTHVYRGVVKDFGQLRAYRGEELRLIDADRLEDLHNLLYGHRVILKKVVQELTKRFPYLAPVKTPPVR